MLYFSEIKGKKVVTEDNAVVGKLEDIIFIASEIPLVTKIVIREARKEKCIIPVSYLKKINKSIILEKKYFSSTLEENELYLMRNLMDKQIIDLKGHKIVRVNDVAVQDQKELYIAGVDIGILGILRWLKIEDILNKLLAVFHITLTSDFLSWGDIQPLELARGQVKLRKKEEKLEKIRPEDLADYLERTNVVNARKFLRILDEKKAAEVIEKLHVNYQTSLFKHYKAERAAKFLNFISPDNAIDVLLSLTSKRRKEILHFVPQKKKGELERLLKFSTTPIGYLLITEFLTVYPDNSVKEVIDKVKKETTEFWYLVHIYVVNKENQLIGVFNLHELLLQDFNTLVYKFMVQSIITLNLTTPVEIALNRMIHNRLQALPVIDEGRHVLGLVAFQPLVKSLSKKIL